MEEKQKNRSGMTKTTSVSVSDKFYELLDRYHLSPTECFRRGVAVTLADMGEMPYDNPNNRERLRRANKVLEEIRKEEKIKEMLIKVKDILEELNNF